MRRCVSVADSPGEFMYIVVDIFVSDFAINSPLIRFGFLLFHRFSHIY
jgi:hypothetical protein